MVCETIYSCEESRYNFQRKLRNVDEGIYHTKPEKTRLSITISKQQAVFQMPAQNLRFKLVLYMIQYSSCGIDLPPFRCKNTSLTPI